MGQEPREELSREFLQLQRRLILLAINVNTAIDRLMGRSIPSVLVQATWHNQNDVNVEQNLNFVRQLRRRPLIRMAFWLQTQLDRSRKAREAVFTLWLWMRGVIWILYPDFLRSRGYQEWSRLYDRPIHSKELRVEAIELVPTIWREQIKQLLLQPSEYFVVITGKGNLNSSAPERITQWLVHHPNQDIFYGDSDHVNAWGRRHSPRFHADFSLEYLVGSDCFQNVSIWRREALARVRTSSAANWWDFLFAELLSRAEMQIGHIPCILFHQRKAFAYQSEWTQNLRGILAQKFPQTHWAAGLKGKPRLIWPLPAQLPLVSAIVPTRDRVDLLQPMLEGVLHSTDYPNLEVIIIDNQSRKPETLDYLSEIQTDKRVKVLSYDLPFNYSAMNNLGFAHTRGELVALLNNDLLVKRPEWLKEMVREVLRPEVGAVGAKLIYKNGFIQHAGVVTGVSYVCTHVHGTEPRSARGYCDRLLFAQPYSAVTAACLLVRREVFQRVRGLDAEHLSVAYNDIDFCLRIGELGYKNIWTPYAELYHLESASRPSDRQSAQLERYRREVEYFHQRWRARLAHPDPYYNPNLTGEGHNFELAFPPRSWHGAALSGE